jgi:putative sterol carrier protein
MADAVQEFFQELESKGHQPLLAKVKGSVRFDLVEDNGATDHWLVAVDLGDFTIAHGTANANCIMRADKALFEQLISGEENAIAATLRGALICTGNVELLFAIQRIFPGPSNQRKELGDEMAST